MAFLKHFDKTLIRQRYGRYRLFFFLSFSLFLLSLVGEMFLFGAGGYALGEGGEVSFSPLFVTLFTGEAIFYLISFLLGITVYAPVVLFLFSLLRGVFSGFVLSTLAASFPQSGLFPFLLSLFYCLFSTHVFCGYSSFCTMVCLRLFTDQPLASYRAEEKRMFGGSLFNSTFFANTVNFRFLFSYTLLFFASLIPVALLSAFAAALLSLVR